MILFYVILILLFINGNKSDEYIKPTNSGDKIRYFNKVIRVTHPITIHPHLTLLFRMKIGDDITSTIADFCTFNEVLDCNPLQQQFTYEYYEFLKFHNINLNNYNSNDESCEINKSDVHVLSCSKELKSKRNSKYNIVNNNNYTNNINKEFHSGGKILTVVSGWWNVTKSKQNINKYYEWFGTSLRINMPYVFFTDPGNFDAFSHYRKDICTVLVPKTISEFITYGSYNEKWIDPLHVPSSELGMIWLEKINLLMEAAKIVDSEYFAWIDAGLPMFRQVQPPIEEWYEDIIKALPYDRVGYAYVKDSYNTHSFGGGFLILHRSVIPLIHYLFYNEYDIARKEFNDWRCGSDQIIFTKLRDKYPELFHSPTYDYGDINFLWGNRYHKTGPSNQVINWDF